MTPLTDKKWTRWLVLLVKVSLCALLIGFVYHAFASGNADLGRQKDWHVQPEWLVLSGFLYLAGMLPASLYWYLVLKRTRQEASLGEAIRAYYISQLGKYVPGKWMVILLRRRFLSGPRVETTVVAASVFYETFTMLGVGSVISAVLLLVWQPEQRLLLAAAVGSALLLGIPTVPAIFQWLLHFFRVGKLNPTAGAKFRSIQPGTILAGWCLVSAGWLLQGMSLWATLRGMGATTAGPFNELSLHTVAVALGIVVGFISQIPGGLVTRDWVSAELLRIAYPEWVGLVSAIIFRLVMLVSELGISIILYLAGWRPRKSAALVEPELSSSARC